jgi:hypothetical protein
MNDNMKLWNSVCATDPAVTKEVNVGRKFTAICAQSQVRHATELWGPIGGAWGIKDEKYEILGVYCIYTAILYIPSGSIPIHADIEIIFSSGKRKGWFNDDFTKKAATDALTKGLSLLGFNADVFEGKFGDNKYVAELKAQKEADKKKTTPPPPKKTEQKNGAPKDPARQKIVNEIVNILTDKVFEDKDRIAAKAEIKMAKSNIALEALQSTWEAKQNKRIIAVECSGSGIGGFEDDIPGELTEDEKAEIDKSADEGWFEEETKEAEKKAEAKKMVEDIY